MDSDLDRIVAKFERRTRKLIDRALVLGFILGGIYGVVLTLIVVEATR